MLRWIRALVLIPAVIVAGCTDNGTGVDADLTGTWVGTFATGGDLRLTLMHLGQDVSGVGIISDARGTGSLFADGTWARAQLELTIDLAARDQDPNPCQAAFTGQLASPDRLQGRFTDCNTNVQLLLTRDPN